MRSQFQFLLGAILLGASMVGLPQTAHADNCLRMYKHANYGGTSWKFCPGSGGPNLSRWNDEVSSMKVPDGYIVAVYEHSGRKGKSRNFTGNVSNVGSSWNDIISSYKLVRGNLSNCVRAYKDASYKGERWDFCPSSYGLPKPDHSKWNDEISSVKIPTGKKVTFCEHVKNGTGKGRCRTFFRSTSWIGRTLNDQFSSLYWQSFNDQSFTMAVISDTQYGYCESNTCKNGPGNADKANDWHSASINALAKSSSNWAGVILNGDVTNVETMGEIDTFEDDYQGRYMNLYIGLGNHDYSNYYDKWCAGDGNATAKYYCTRRIMQWFEDHVESIPGTRFDLKKDGKDREGSYAYKWDIGNYTFFQLNNAPTYQRDFRVYISSKVHKERYDINRSISWLKKELEGLPGDRRVVINMHSFAACDQFCSSSSGYDSFLEALDAHPNVVAIFAGHLHEKIGWDYQGSGASAGTNRKEVTTPGGKVIPYFFAGGAEYNHYLKVDFGRTRMVVTPIDSRRGGTNPVSSRIARTVTITY